MYELRVPIVTYSPVLDQGFAPIFPIRRREESLVELELMLYFVADEPHRKLLRVAVIHLLDSFAQFRLDGFDRWSHCA